MLLSIRITIILILSIYLRFSTVIIVRCSQSTEMCLSDRTDSNTAGTKLWCSEFGVICSWTVVSRNLSKTCMCISEVRLIQAVWGDSYTVALHVRLCEVRLARYAVDVCITLFICVVACFRTFPRFASFINRAAYSETTQRCLPRVFVDCIDNSLSYIHSRSPAGIYCKRSPFTIV
jgi:hypothetical protein